ncbi:hypothetical protein XPA_001945 [Xanthoria parietina]
MDQPPPPWKTAPQVEVPHGRIYEQRYLSRWREVPPSMGGVHLWIDDVKWLLPLPSARTFKLPIFYIVVTVAIPVFYAFSTTFTACDILFRHPSPPSRLPTYPFSPDMIR